MAHPSTTRCCPGRRVHRDEGHAPQSRIASHFHPRPAPGARQSIQKEGVLGPTSPCRKTGRCNLPSFLIPSARLGRLCNAGLQLILGCGEHHDRQPQSVRGIGRGQVHSFHADVNLPRRIDCVRPLVRRPTVDRRALVIHKVPRALDNNANPTHLDDLLAHHDMAPQRRNSVRIWRVHE